MKIHRAIDKLHEALLVNPRDDGAYVDLGFCYAAIHDGPTAIDMYTKATQINPSGPNFKELADVYLRTGDAEKGLEAANAGIVKDPRSAPLYNAKGMALHDLGRYDQAEVAFRKALEIDPGFAIAQSNLRALDSSKGRGNVAQH
jgi:Flp pilus assembly protein TadD